jgi:hypothetical protein
MNRIGLEAQISPNTEAPEKPRTSSGRSILPQLDSRMAWSQEKRCSCSWRDCLTPQTRRAPNGGAYCERPRSVPLCYISQPPFEDSGWPSTHEGVHGFGGAGGGPGGRLGGLGGLPQSHAATPLSLPFSHRAAAADLRPTAENIVG